MRISDWSSDVCSSDLNVVTRRPSYTQSAEGELTVGNYGAFGVSGSYNDALGDAAAFSVYAAKRKRDGWMDVRTGNGPRTNDEDYDQNRSEEHTSELQSLMRISYAVFCLKKKKQQQA